MDTRKADDSSGTTEPRHNTDFDLGGRSTGNRVAGKDKKPGWHNPEVTPFGNNSSRA